MVIFYVLHVTTRKVRMFLNLQQQSFCELEILLNVTLRQFRISWLYFVLLGGELLLQFNCFYTQIPDTNSALITSSAVLYMNDCKLVPKNGVYLDNRRKL